MNIAWSHDPDVLFGTHKVNDLVLPVGHAGRSYDYGQFTNCTLWVQRWARHTLTEADTADLAPVPTALIATTLKV